MTDRVTKIDSKIVGWKIVESPGDNKNSESHVKKETLSSEKKKRPTILPGYTYALRSQLLKNTLYITINDIEEDGTVRPFEIFFNTRDTSKFVELQIITRLISAIFRRSETATFVIDELRAVANPENTGYMRPPRDGENKGSYIPSIFYEIGEVIELHYEKMKEPNRNIAPAGTTMLSKEIKTMPTITTDIPVGEKCPNCHEKTAHRKDGCLTCLSCGYSKCG